MHPRAIILVSLFVALAGVAPLSAQVTTNFRAERERLLRVARETQLAKGLSEGEMLRIPLLTPMASPGPEIQKVLPGGSVAVTVRGDFPAGTIFLSERDDVTISGAAVSTTTYSARLAIPPDEGPGFVRLWAFTPIGIRGPAAVAFVQTLYRFDLRSPDGYTVRIAPVEEAFRLSDNREARVKYRAEFYSPGETTAFETNTGYQVFYANQEASAMLDIGIDQSTTSPDAEMDAIREKMNDPKTTEAERNVLLARMLAVQGKMFEDMNKAMQTDPASLNKKQADFGCVEARLTPGTGGVVAGHISCGQNFHDGMLKVTGTMTQLK